MYYRPREAVLLAKLKRAVCHAYMPVFRYIKVAWRRMPAIKRRA